MVNPVGALAASKLGNDDSWQTEAIMKTSNKHWLPGAVGALVGIAVVGAFGDNLVPVGAGALKAAFAAGANLGLAVTEFVALGFILGLTAFGLRQLIFGASGRRSSLRAAVENAPAMPALILSPRLADATASEFDGVAVRSFAPVMSLTEAQVARERAARRRRERRAASERA